MFTGGLLCSTGLFVGSFAKNIGTIFISVGIINGKGMTSLNRNLEIVIDHDNHQKSTPGLLATYSHIYIQIILTMIISGDYFW